MLETIFLIAAVVGGTVMLCQFVMTLMGAGDDGADGGVNAGDAFDGDFDAGDFDGGDSLDSSHHAAGHHQDANWLFKAISLRTLVAAFAFFGVAGMAATSAGAPPAGSVAVAIAAGLAAMYGVYWLMQSIGKLASSGNERIENALGCRATVYVRIPAARKGAGKVTLTLQNRTVEYQAVTDDPEPLRTGEPVEVVAVSGDDMVCVSRIAEPISA